MDALIEKERCRFCSRPAVFVSSGPGDPIVPTHEAPMCLDFERAAYELAGYGAGLLTVDFEGYVPRKVDQTP